MSVDTLIARMRRAREIVIDAAGHQFTARLLNAGEMADLGESLAGKALTQRRVVEAAIVGWNLVELDLVPGGGPEPVDFHPVLFREWLAENMDATTELFAAISAEWEARRARVEAAEKN